MNRATPDITYVPYRQAEEPHRRAALVRVDFPLEGLSDGDLQVLGHLSEAVNLINPVYRDQFEPITPLIRRFAQRLLPLADPSARALLQSYLTMLDLQNSPYSLLPRKNHLLPLERADVEALVKKMADKELKEKWDLVAPYFFEGFSLPDKAGLYPPDMTEEEWEKLGESAKVVNSTVSRQDGKLSVRINEERYKKTLEPVLRHLTAARDHSSHPGFRMYLDAKIEEMRHGTVESRRIADYMWIKHGSPIDVIISTALEVYIDNWKNARGEAAGNVLRMNEDAQSLLLAMADELPKLEANAPWKHRKTEIDPTRLPQLRFVDVLNWSGDYVNAPMTIIAQSLPNDSWVINHVGAVNMVYRNTGEAVYSISGNLLAKEFLPNDIVEKYGELIFEGGQIHSALHELGHTTGAMTPDLEGKEPREILEAEYSPLEEARAELFAMFAMPRISRQGIITEEMAIAGHYSMLLSMVQGLKFEPVQAHVKARNIMWHVLCESGAIEEIDEDGKRKFQVNLKRIDQGVEELLAEVGNIKAAGDKIKAAELREENCFTDALRPEIEKRTATIPLGRGLIFPQLKKEGDRYLGELVYSDEFSDQPKFQADLLD